MAVTSGGHWRRAARHGIVASGLCLVAASVVACGGEDVTTSDPGGAGTAGTGGAAGSPSVGAEPITGPCPAPLASAADVALTPRADPNMELMALALEPDKVVASQGTYDRLVSDVAAIRALEPTLREVNYASWYDGRNLQLQLSDAASQANAEGVYTAWDCLNDAYGLASMSANDRWVTLLLDGTYNLPLLLENYRELPGVIGGSAGGTDGDGPKICVTRSSDHYEYVVDDTRGYCPTDCTEHHAFHFSSEAAGQVASLDAWDSTTDAPVPAWFASVCNFEPRVTEF